MSQNATPHFWAGSKIVQIGQTEAKSRGFLRTRRCTKVLREAKFVQNAKHIIHKFVAQTNFYLNFCLISSFAQLKWRYYGFSCALRDLCILKQPLFCCRFTVTHNASFKYNGNGEINGRKKSFKSIGRRYRLCM